MTEQRRRLADRLLDAGTDVARRYVEADRYDPGRPSLGMLVAETLAQHERIGEERILARVRALAVHADAWADTSAGDARRALDRGSTNRAATHAHAASTHRYLGHWLREIVDETDTIEQITARQTVDRPEPAEPEASTPADRDALLDLLGALFARTDVPEEVQAAALRARRHLDRDRPVRQDAQT